jgi:acyl carrier protein
MEDSVADFDVELFFGVLVKHLKLTGANSPIEIDSNLFALGLDSTDALNLLLDLEERSASRFQNRFLLTTPSEHQEH